MMEVVCEVGRVNLTSARMSNFKVSRCLKVAEVAGMVRACTAPAANQI